MTRPRKKVEGWDLLHPNQQKIYEMLVAQDDDEPLTLDDMRNDLGVRSINTVVHHLRQLEKKGYVRRRGDNSPLEVLPAPIRDIVYLNLYGTVGCSPKGFFNDDNVIEKVPFPAKQLRVTPDSFLVEARGDSMEPLIHNQDLVLVERASVVTSGTTAVVVHNHEAKLKKVYIEKGHVVLQSLNPRCKPIVEEDPKNLRAVGVVRGVVRSFPNDSLRAKKNRP